MSDESLARQLVVFSLGEEEYALPITQVHEIIRFTEPRSVASADPGVRGVISLRGKILPVYDLATRLGLAHEPRAEGEAKIVIVETADDMAGVVVGDVEEVLTVTAEQLEAVPSADIQTIESIAKIGDRLVVLLDPEGIVGRAGEDLPVAAAPVASDDLRVAA
jgi:purine-binding chemotaxis protein CheW